MPMTNLQKFLNASVSNVAPMRANPKNGDLFGLELECEGTNIAYNPRHDEDMQLGANWTPHADGSLRNNHGQAVEWVFLNPVDYDSSVKNVKILFNYFNKAKAKIVTSNRTSTHVHFNMSDKKVYQLVNMYILFTIFEDILDTFGGEDRNGNLFCLSSRYAENQMRQALHMFLTSFNIAINEQMRYASFNMAALNKFGSVEFRGMRGLDNEQDVLDWLQILNEFCRYACYEMKNPVDIIEAISHQSPIGFMGSVFSPKSFELLTRNLSADQINSSIYEGVRLCQMLCYKVGTEFDQVRIQGPDFWASFNNGVIEPPPPELAAKKKMGNPFRVAPRIAPMRMADPWVVAQDLADWAGNNPAPPEPVLDVAQIIAREHDVGWVHRQAEQRNALNQILNNMAERNEENGDQDIPL